MRVLLSTIGSRGDVQPLVALAMELKRLRQEVRVCAPPGFRDWLEAFGIPFLPIGPDPRSGARAGFSTPGKPTPREVQRMMESTVATQFETIPKAAKGCAIIVGANALQIAASSVAETMGIRYVFVAYSPAGLPSSHHAPPAVLGWTPRDEGAGNPALWAEDAGRWNERWGPSLNAQRTRAGLAPVTDVRGYVLTTRPWLAADATLAPGPADLDVFQTGAWILPDRRPLSTEVEVFLDAGDPPVYFGFGSMRAPLDLGSTMVESARALGRRALVLRGWGDLTLPDDGADCLSIGEVNQQLLFRRVAAVVHHGGAGTTTAATHAGAPQVVIPQAYDQPYFARRVAELGIGIAHAPGAPTAVSLAGALARALEPAVATRARSVAASVRTDGAAVAAQRLVNGPD